MDEFDGYEGLLSTFLTFGSGKFDTRQASFNFGVVFAV
jgi:hypothetical protein